MLLHNQRAAQRNHHQDAEQPAQNGDQHHPRKLKVETENHDRRHRYANAKSDRFAGRARGLHDVVFKNRCFCDANLAQNSKETD